MSQSSMLATMPQGPSPFLYWSTLDLWLLSNSLIPQPYYFWHEVIDLWLPYVGIIVF